MVTFLFYWCIYFLQNAIGNNAKEVDEQEEEEEDEHGPNHPQRLHMQQQMQKPDIPHQPHNQPDEYDGDEMNRDNQVKNHGTNVETVKKLKT